MLTGLQGHIQTGSSSVQTLPQKNIPKKEEEKTKNAVV